MALSFLAMKQYVLCVLYIYSLVLPSELLSASSSELCIQPTDSSSCTCQTCGFVTSEPHKMCVKGDIICIPANYSKFELPNQVNATKVNYVIFGIDCLQTKIFRPIEI